MPATPLSVVVLISGSGSNLQALIDQQTVTPGPFSIKAVISNKADAYGLERAKKAAIPAKVLSHAEFDGREAYDTALSDLIEEHQPDLVVLAGFMRILSKQFVQEFHGRLLNIHPSLLPKYKGLHTHKRALEAADQVHGASVHFVTEELDGGPVALQARVPVEPSDNEESLAARVLTREHIIYPMAVKWMAEKRLCLEDHQLLLNGKPMKGPIVLEFQRENPSD